MKIIVDFLYETSFTGYEQEELKDTLDELEQARKEIEQGTANPFSFEEMQKHAADDFGYVPEERDPSEEEAWRQWVKSSIDYSETCKTIEVRKLREMIWTENSNP